MNAQRSKTKMAENEELDLQHDHEGFYCGYCSQCGTQIEREYIFCPQCEVNIERGYLSHTLTLGIIHFLSVKLSKAIFTVALNTNPSYSF